jgi:ABC-type transport system involved in cytochrome bd biosynthesis fused ATPase/permease subunit
MRIFEEKTKKVFSISLALLGKKGSILLLVSCFLIVCLDFLGVALLVPLLKFSQDDSFQQLLHTLYGIDANSRESLLFVIAIFFSFTVIKNFILFFSNRYKYGSMFSIQEKLSRLLLAEYLKKNFSYFKNLTFAQVSRNVISESGHFVSFLINFVDISIETLVFLSIFLFLGFRNLTLYFFFLLLALVGLIVFSYTKKKMHALGSVRVLSERERVSEIQGIYNLFKEIKIYDSGNYFLKRYEKPNHEVAESHARENSIRPLSKYIYEIITVFFIFTYVGLYYGDQFFYENLLLVFAALFRLFPSFTRIIISLQQLEMHKKSVNGVIEVFPKENFDIKFLKNEPEVDWRVDSFSYELIKLVVGDKTISNIQMKLDASDKMVLLRAQSGFGKSLFLSCMVGLLEAEAIYQINGQVVSDDDVKKLRLFSFNTQSSQLLNETIIANILFDSSERDLNQEDLQRSINISGLISLLKESSEGIYTLLSDKGHNLSGGQQQRVTLARTIYKRKPIMILDESLSALDKEAQSEILIRLRREYPGKVILVSHDPIDPVFFDKVINYE